MNDKPRVVYWNNQPTPYVVERFNAVADRGNVRLEAWFDNYREPDRSWDVDPSEWRFPARVLGTTDADRALDRIPIELLDETRPDLLITNYDRRHMVLGTLAAWSMVDRRTVRCLPSWPAWETSSPLQVAAKHLLFRGIDAAKVPGPDGAAYAARFGLPADRAWPVTQSVNVDLYGRARSVTPHRRTELRTGLGVTGCVFVYVGRVWSGKGVDDLVTAFDLLQRTVPDVSLLIVGDGPDEQRLRAATRSDPRIHWTGFVQPRELPELYAAADVLVFPTLGDPNGLVVEEAMAAGLPVISTECAGDIRRRLPAEAGRIVPANDPPALAAAMAELAQHSDLRRRLGDAAAELAAQATPEHFARDFEAFVAATLNAPPRRTVAARMAGPAARLVQLAIRRRHAEPITPAQHGVVTPGGHRL